MKLNGDFLMHYISGEHVLVSVGKTKFSGLARGNDTAAFIIEQLKNETTKEEVVSKLLEKYNVERDIAEKDVESMIEKLRSIGAIVD